LGVVAYWLIPTMVLVGVVNVVGRFAGQALSTNLSSNALLELQWQLFSLTIFLGAPYALLHNEHVRVDVLYSRYNDNQRAWVNLIGTILFLIPFCCFLIYFSWSFVQNAWRIQEYSGDPGGLPIYPIKTLIPIGAGLLIIQAMSEVIKNIAHLRGQQPAEEAATPPHEAAAPVAPMAREPQETQAAATPDAPDEREARQPDAAQSQEEQSL
jgi:TRAP-type mannitol/chloroaromatic compound transport system permease small subunit